MTAQENDKRYLICANWWREWCDYANFDLSQLVRSDQTVSRNHQMPLTSSNNRSSIQRHQESTIVEI